MIEPKKKPCKGIGPAKAFKGCGTPTFHRVHGLGKMCGCYSDWLLSTPEGQEKMNRAALKATAPRREFEQAKKERKNREKITTLIHSVKEVCHKYIRLRDKGKPCISCGTPWKDDFEAGHFYKAEIFSSIKFNEHNIHGQCIQCNRRKEGAFNDYSLRLPERIGEEAYEDLKHLARMEKRNDFKWERDKLKDLRTYYRTKIKQL